MNLSICVLTSQAVAQISAVEYKRTPLPRLRNKNFAGTLFLQTKQANLVDEGAE
jgi:hypothetical protein